VGTNAARTIGCQTGPDCGILEKCHWFCISRQKVSQICPLDQGYFIYVLFPWPIYSLLFLDQFSTRIFLVL